METTAQICKQVSADAKMKGSLKLKDGGDTQRLFLLGIFRETGDPGGRGFIDLHYGVDF